MLSCGHEISIGYFGKPRAPGIMPALLATYTGDFDTVDDARKAAIADADNPKIGPVDSITIDPIGDRWVKGESLVRKRQRMGTQARTRMNGRVSFHFQRIANQPQSRIELALSGTVESRPGYSSL